MNVLQKITTPQESVNDDTLLVVKIHVVQGQEVEAGVLLAEFESSKAIIEIHNEAKGFVSIHCNEGDEVGVGAVIFEITDEPAATSIGKTNPVPQTINAPLPVSDIKETLFSNKALELIAQHQLKKEDFTGHDFVSENTVKEKLGMPAEQVLTRKPTGNRTEAKATARISTENIPGAVKIDPMKRREIESLSVVNSTGMVSNLVTEIHCEGYEHNITRYQKIIISTPLPLMIFECSRILPKFKNLNAYYIDGNIVSHHDVNVGFAVDLGKGLKVLNIRNSDKKSLDEIETEILRLVDAYNADTLSKEDLTGITFTITDLFISVVSNFLPLVNKGNSAILGISSPGMAKKNFSVSVSFDHRVTNGREVSEFLAVLKSRMDVYLSDSSTNK